MGKGTKAQEVAELLRDARAAGIYNHLYVICGFPTEKPAEFADSLRFLDQNKTNISAIHRSMVSLA